jgi:hypothetical protein
MINVKSVIGNITLEEMELLCKIMDDNITDLEQHKVVKLWEKYGSKVYDYWIELHGQTLMDEWIALHSNHLKDEYLPALKSYMTDKFVEWAKNNIK